MIKGEPVVIWGSAGHAKVLAEVVALQGGRVLALFDNDPTARACLPGVPLFIGVVGFREWVYSQESLAGISGAIAIGGSRGAARQQLMAIMEHAGLRLPSLVHPNACISSTARIGEGSQVLAHAVVAAEVSMGQVCIVNHGASVDHECRLEAGVHVAPGAVLCGCVDVGENAMVGAGAVVLPRIRIGREAVVGAGAVVTRDVPDGTVVFGNPAKIIRSVK